MERGENSVKLYVIQNTDTPGSVFKVNMRGEMRGEIWLQAKVENPRLILL